MLTLLAAFRMHFEDIHCQHIVLGASGDNGYARLLSAYADSDKMTLLGGPPFEKELVEFTQRFPSMTCSKVFHDRGLFKQVTPLLVSSSQPVETTTSPSDSGKNINAADCTHTHVTAAEVPSPRCVPLNAAGERVDPGIPCSPELVRTVKNMRLCDGYHLTGRCKLGDQCSYKHGERATDRIAEVMRFFARCGPCPKGPGCRNSRCLWGHFCPRGV
jgi:hypothetical protein